MELLEKPRKFDKLFLAPLFLFSAYLLLPSGIYVNKLLPIGGIFLCLVFQKKGLYLALALIFIDSIFQHLTSTSHFWLIGFEISLVLSFWIFHNTYSDAKKADERLQNTIKEQDEKYLEVQKQMDKKIERAQDTIQTLENERQDLDVSLKSLQSEMQSYLQLINTLKGAKELEIQAREQLSKELIDKKQTINSLELELISNKEKLAKIENRKFEQEHKELIHELNHFRVKQFQTSLINEAFAYFTNQEIKNMKVIPSNQFDKKSYQQVRQLMGNYEQLKKQFKEKDRILHLTRKELYDNKTEYEVLKNKFDELKLKPKNTEKMLSKQIDELLLENEHLLQENRELEKILEKALTKDHSSESRDYLV